MEKGNRPNGEADPTLVRAGSHFDVTWAFISGYVAAYVYELYEADPVTGFTAERPVYVGQTRDFPSRWSSHLNKTWWIGDVDLLCVTLTGYPTPGDARKAEAQLIERHHPMHNAQQEQAYAQLARSEGVPDDTLLAELVPVGRRR